MPSRTDVPAPTEPLLSPASPPSRDVSVWRAQSRRSQWHTDFGCSRFRGRQRPVCVTARADQLHGFLFGQTPSERSQPCPACAVPVLLDLAVEWARLEGADAAPLALACPRPEASHSRCVTCRTLGAFAARHRLAAHQDGGGYQVVAVPALERHLLWFARTTLAVHEIPAVPGPVGEDLLAVAWALRQPAAGAGFPVERGATCAPATGLFHPAHTLRWDVADLVTAAAPA